MSLVNVKNIYAGYGEKIIIQDINFTVEKGELTALLGLNGMGKTTLLKVISGLLKPHSGECLVKDGNLFQLREKDRAKRVSYVPQKNSIIYDTQVIDVVLMGITPYLKVFESPSKDHEKSAYNKLKIVGMEKHASSNFLTLSEGQKQLVLIARSLMQNAEVMLFDEPDSSLDYKNKHLVLSKIREIIKEEGKGGVITLHDPNYALSYCDRVIILNHGRIASEFDINNKLNKKSLHSTFNRIYGNIEVIEYNNRYVIV